MNETMELGLLEFKTTAPITQQMLNISDVADLLSGINEVAPSPRLQELHATMLDVFQLLTAIHDAE